MSDSNGKGMGVRTALCRNCGMAIKTTKDAFYMDEEWFCDSRCHNQHLDSQDGHVPA